mgnify:CR=1 FL=1
MATNGLVIAGLGSGSGKTTLTLGILRALSRRAVAEGAAKIQLDARFFDNVGDTLSAEFRESNIFQFKLFITHFSFLNFTCKNHGVAALCLLLRSLLLFGSRFEYIACI